MFLSSGCFFPSLTYMHSYRGEKRTQRLLTFVLEGIAADWPPWDGEVHVFNELLNYLCPLRARGVYKAQCLGQILNLGHWHCWIALDGLRLDNCPSSNSQSTMRWKSLDFHPCPFAYTLSQPSLRIFSCTFPTDLSWLEKLFRSMVLTDPQT